jgi:nicotinamidase-related amidase
VRHWIRCIKLDTLHQEAQGMLNFQGMTIPQSLEEIVSPQNTAFIVYDMQSGITRQIANSAEITAGVHKILEGARRAGMRIFFTRHMSLPKNLMGAFQCRTAMAWQRPDSPERIHPMFLRDSPAFQIIPELQPLPSEAFVDKITMSAFEGTFLEIALRDCGIRSFIIAGIALEIGIDPTCRQGADLGLIPILVQDACGFGNETAANHSLAALSQMGDTVITETKAVCELLGR